MQERPESSQSLMVAERIVPLDRARTFLTFLVVLYHSVINYTHFGIGGDRMRWLGFDLIVLFNDSFFMACMFFISGLFVHDSLARRGAANFLSIRAWRLGIPYLVSIFVLMPIAYFRYQFPAANDVNFLHFWWHMLTVGPWPSGSAWFLWVLLALDAIAGLLWAAAPRAIEALGRWAAARYDRPMVSFAAFLVFSIVLYLPLRLEFGEASWFTPGHYPLPIQISRILLYAGYFLAGVVVGSAGLRVGLLAEKGEVAKRWVVWLAFALIFYGAILLLVYAHHKWIVDFRSPPLWWHTTYALCFAMFCASMTFTIPAVSLRFARSRLWLLDVMQPSAYGIYLLHFVPLIWLQYLVYDPDYPAFVKFAIVLTGTLSTSWGLTLLLRKIPVVARMI
ncbi:acyltransferase family protein [Bradyrhizobium sp.]|uniref:acyltransferase family protein n=1 Tax=Bradyrhizobium sp. TaxID=376 RepID=UPI003C3B69FE